MGKSIKDLVAEQRKPVIAHHSTWLGIDPHELNEGTSIHAGTKEAAVDRLEEAAYATVKNSDYEPGEILDAYLHSYEIPRGLISPTKYLDPIYSRRKPSKNIRHSNTSRKRLRQQPAPESIESYDMVRSPYINETRGVPKKNLQVLQYQNVIEDPGSTSYVIPSALINSGRVKHLGQQFLTSTTMSGGVYFENDDEDDILFHIERPDVSKIKDRP